LKGDFQTQHIVEVLDQEIINIYLHL